MPDGKSIPDFSIKSKRKVNLYDNDDDNNDDIDDDDYDNNNDDYDNDNNDNDDYNKDDNFNKEFLYEKPVYDIQNDVTLSFNKYPEMNDYEKLKFLFYTQEQIIDNEECDFNPNPFSLESLQILIENTTDIKNAHIYKIILNIANFICQKFPKEANILEASGFLSFFNDILYQKKLTAIIIDIFNFFTIFFSINKEFIEIIFEEEYIDLWTEIIFNPSILELDYDVISYGNLEYTIDISTITLKYDLLLSGLNFLKKFFPLFPSEYYESFLSNREYLIYIFQILAEINTQHEIDQYTKENKNYYLEEEEEESISESPINLVLKDDKNIKEPQVFNEVLIFIVLLCDIDFQSLSPIFLIKYQNEEYVKKTRARIRYNQPFLYHMIKYAKDTVEKGNHISENIQILLSSIILNLLQLDFDFFINEVVHCCFYDFICGFLTNRIPLPHDCIQIFILILTNPQPDDIRLHKIDEAVYNVLNSYLKSEFQIKYPICIAFAKLSLTNDVTDNVLDQIFDTLNIIPEFLDCINTSNDEDSIVFLSSIYKLIQYKLSKESLEDLSSYLDEIDFEFDSLSVNRENPEIDSLINSIEQLVSFFEEND